MSRSLSCPKVNCLTFTWDKDRVLKYSTTDLKEDIGPDAIN